MAFSIAGLLSSVKSAAVSGAKNLVAQQKAAKVGLYATTKAQTIFKKPLAPELAKSSTIGPYYKSTGSIMLEPKPAQSPLFKDTSIGNVPATSQTWGGMSLQDRLNQATSTVKSGGWVQGAKMFAASLNPELQKFSTLQAQQNEAAQTKQQATQQYAKNTMFDWTKQQTNVANPTMATLPKPQQTALINKTATQNKSDALVQDYIQRADAAFVSSLKKARPGLLPSSAAAEKESMIKNAPGQVLGQAVHGFVGGLTMGLSDMAKERFGMDYSNNLPTIFKDNEATKAVVDTVGGVANFVGNMVGGGITFGAVAKPMSTALAKIPGVGQILAAHPVFTSYVVDNAVLTGATGVARKAMGLDYTPQDFFEGMVQNAENMAAFAVAGKAWEMVKGLPSKAIFGKMNDALVKAEQDKGSQLTPEEAQNAMMDTRIVGSIYGRDLFAEKRMAELKGGKKGTPGINYPTPLPSSTEKITNPLEQPGQQNAPGTNFVTEKPLELPAPEYNPAKHEAYMEAGKADLGRKKSMTELTDEAVRKIHDSNAPLLQIPDKRGMPAATYLKAAQYKTKQSGNVTLAAEALKKIYTFPEKLQGVFDDLQTHRQLAQRGAEGLKNPGMISTAEAQARINDVYSKLSPPDKVIIDKAEAAARNWTKEYIQKPLKDAGIVDEATLQKWNKVSPDYLPQQIRHWMEQENVMSGSGTSMKANEPGFLKKAEGANSQADTDTFRVRLKQLQQLNNAIARKTVTDQAIKDWGEPVKKSTDTTAHELANPGKTIITNLAGEKYSVPMAVKNVIAGLNNEQMGIIGDTFKKFASLKRTGATSARVGFAISNPLKDPQSAKMYMGSKFSYAKDWAPSVAKELWGGLTGKMSDAKIEALKRGGLSGGMITSERGNIRGTEFTPKERMKPLEKVMDVLKNYNIVYKVAKVAGEAGEDATRIAVGKAVDRLTPEQQGEVLNRLNPKFKTYVTNPDVSPAELKAFLEQRVTMDFNQQGDEMRVWNRVMPFLNVNEKNVTRNVSMAKSDPMGTAVRYAKYAALPTLMNIGWNAMQGGDDDIDSYTKSKYFAFKTGLKTKDAQGNEVPLVIAIPKGEAGIQDVSNSVQEMYDLVVKKDPAMLKQVQPLLYSLASGEDVPGSAAAQLLQNIPQVPVITPLIEALTNKDFYRNRPIDSTKWQNIDWTKLTPEALSQIQTPEAYKMLAQYTGVSPFQIKHFVEGLYPAGSQYASAANVVMGKSKWSDVNQFVPIVRPAYTEDKSLSGAYASKDKAKVETTTENTNVKASVDAAIAALKNKDKAKAVEILKTIPEDKSDYAQKYFTTQTANMQKKQSGATQTDMVIASMSGPEAIQYFEDNIRKTHDKQALVDFLGKLDSQKAGQDVLDHITSTSSAQVSP